MSLDPFGHPEQPGTAAAVKFEGHGSGWPVDDVDVQRQAAHLTGPGLDHHGRQPVGHGVMEFSREVNPLVADRLVRVPRSFCLKQLSRLSQLRSQPAA
jgi:hypothetical protein